MQDIMSALYDYISEHTSSLRNDPEYQKALKAYMALEEEVKEKIGDDLLYKYQCTEADVFHRRDIAVFVQSLRFSYRFMAEVLR